MKTRHAATTIRRHSAAAHIEFMPGEVLHLRMTGPVTAATLAAFAAGVCDRYGDLLLTGFVFDYRGVVLAASNDDLAQLLGGLAANSPLRRPAAFVTGPASESVLRLQAERMAAAGFYRRAFETVARGHAWVLKIAARGF